MLAPFFIFILVLYLVIQGCIFIYARNWATRYKLVAWGLLLFSPFLLYALFDSENIGAMSKVVLISLIIVAISSYLIGLIVEFVNSNLKNNESYINTKSQMTNSIWPLVLIGVILIPLLTFLVNYFTVR